MSEVTARMAAAVNEITISGDEYRELVIKAWKYDSLRKAAKKSTFNTELERTIFDLPEDKEETDDVDS